MRTVLIPGGGRPLRGWDGTNTTGYVYDTQNQLVRENNPALNKTYTWVYDNAGNILSRNEYAYTTGTLGTPVDTVSYTYGDSSWGDLLTAYDGKPITYDTIGNPLTYDGWTFNWQHGRQLASMSKGNTTWTNTYDANGMRTKRTDGTTTYQYVYNGSSLSQMTVGGNTLRFAYDANGIPMAVTYNGTTYYYATNLQSDIVAILNASGTAVVEYTYDAWGNILTATGTMASTLGTHNPLRYRGYVYDTETELYYVSSRHYNPEIGRWINADSQISNAGGDVLGCNLFGYCTNNPVNMTDFSGRWPSWIGNAVKTIVNAVEKVVSTFVSVATSVISFVSNIVTASLPTTGDPDSSQTLRNPDGTPKQKRWYGPDGKAKRDRDYNHGGDWPFPHDHEWNNGKRGEEHLPPSPEYEFSWEPVAGVGLVTICAIGIAFVAVDDVTGIGVVDDFLFGPLGVGIESGLIMIFG